ncbi:hypothetical protein ACG7TL_001222 [Trametes sanguinea]
MQTAQRSEATDFSAPSSSGLLLPTAIEDVDGPRQVVPPDEPAVVITITRTRTHTIFQNSSSTLVKAPSITVTTPEPTPTVVISSISLPPISEFPTVFDSSPVPAAFTTSTKTSASAPKTGEHGSSSSTHSSSQLADATIVPGAVPLLGIEPEFVGNIAATSCAETTIRWTYSGPEDKLEIGLSDRSSSQAAAREGAPMHTVAQVDANEQEWAWFANVTSGWYVMSLAIQVDIQVLSSPFFVQNSSDTSCLASSGGSSQVSTSPPTPSTLSTSLATSPVSSAISPSTSGATTSSTSSRAGAVAGIVVAAIAALITVAALVVCVRAVLARRMRRARPATRRQPETWLGLPASSDTTRTDSVSIPSINEKGLLGSEKDTDATVPAPLQPNRRKPSVLAIDTAAAAPPQVKNEAPTLPVSGTEAREIRGDSPTLPPSAYVTRKPVPPLPSYESVDTTKPSSRDPRKSKDYDPSLASAVPSTATSRMYRTRDSGWSTSAESRFYRELGNARASSVIDPHLVGALKPMQNSMIPDVPPLPPNYM